MTIVKYRHSRYGTSPTITKEVFVKETSEFFITEGGRKWKKDAQEFGYKDTWEEARDVLLKRAKYEVQCAQRSVKDIEAMTKPPWMKS
jgi:hypothetical protein